MLYITNGRIVTENEIIHGYVGIEDGVISSLGTGNPPGFAENIIDAGGNLVTPGFIDVHCHGGGGKLFADDPETAYEAHLKNGTTGILPTIGYNMPKEKFTEAISKIAGMKDEGVLGINSEGPFINPEYGADTSLVRKVNKEEYENIYTKGKGKIRIWMLSPEIEGAEELKEFIESKLEIIPCAGHTGCSAKQLRGIRHICHLFDAMGPKNRTNKAIHENGTAEAILAGDEYYAELIADYEGVHVPAELLTIAYRCMGDRIVLISDAISTVDEDSASDLNYNDCGELSGSLLSVSRAVCNMKKHTGIGWPDAVKLGSLNPARLLRLDKERGSIALGKRADLAIMDEKAKIYSVIVNGRRVK